MRHDKKWLPADEKAFIDKLGTHSEHGLPRLQLLRKYMVTLEQRKDCGSINKAKTIEYLKEAIYREKVNPAKQTREKMQVVPDISEEESKSLAVNTSQYLNGCDI